MTLGPSLWPHQPPGRSHSSSAPFRRSIISSVSPRIFYIPGYIYSIEGRGEENNDHATSIMESRRGCFRRLFSPNQTPSPLVSLTHKRCEGKLLVIHFRIIYRIKHTAYTCCSATTFISPHPTALRLDFLSAARYAKDPLFNIVLPTAFHPQSFRPGES